MNEEHELGSERSVPVSSFDNSTANDLTGLSLSPCIHGKRDSASQHLREIKRAVEWTYSTQHR